MQRTLLCTLLVGWGCLVWTNTLKAQNPNGPVTVYFKSAKAKPIRSVIGEESAKGVRLKTKAENIPASEILDIDYAEQMDTAKGLATYRPAIVAEKAARQAKSPEERLKKLSEALAKYKAAGKQMAANLYAARRNVDFKIGYLYGQLSLTKENLAQRGLAIKYLQEFKKKHPDSWQFTRAMRMLATLQAKNKDFAGVRKTVAALAAAKVSDQVKQESQLLLADLLMQAQKYGDAQKTLQGLIAKLPKGSPMQIRARLAEASALAGTGDKLKEAVTKLKTILEESKDKNLRAIAYNTLGECYYRKDMLQQARWQFLWVDVIYNQNKEQRAKALYYLWRVFERLQEFDRGQEFFNTLVNGQDYVGSPWQQKAIEEAKKSQQ